MSGPVPRVRRDEVRRRLLDAAAEVFAERGYRAARLDEVAQQSTRDPDLRQVYVGVRRSLRNELAATLAEACDQLGIELTVPTSQLALTLQSLRLGLALEHGTDPDLVDRAAITAVFTSTLRGVIRAPDSAATKPPTGRTR
ncbi:TetR family transcriptional regulator C-terminal domain-containing protein [Nocardia sp. BMG51109]|uniref:TetR family transcriptional regulator C-terminal domain-containing protein n=1 Tax=Nocardia sp. BMG51109 TaxID=1056816 RepID=UPI000A04AFBD|nr:TetR family transcriptional regulator C-terminal domain-containing protein [Nocardia sp. BMG51109]